MIKIIDILIHTILLSAIIILSSVVYIALVLFFGCIVGTVISIGIIYLIVRKF